MCFKMSDLRIHGIAGFSVVLSLVGNIGCLLSILRSLRFPW